MFLERLASRNVTAGGKTITKVDGKDLLTQYGTISISDCKTAAQGYLKLNKDADLVINKQSQMSHKCSIASKHLLLMNAL